MSVPSTSTTTSSAGTRSTARTYLSFTPEQSQARLKNVNVLRRGCSRIHRCYWHSHVSHSVLTETHLNTAFDLIANHEALLVTLLLAFLTADPRIRIIRPPTSDPTVRVSTLPFVVSGRGSREIVEAVDKAGIAGHFYAKRLVEEALELGEEGVIIGSFKRRVSMIGRLAHSYHRDMVHLSRSLLTSWVTYRVQWKGCVG
ncbi:hypothetical protein BC937DRAFT_90625 [Endogone sp. FLAS-F59071]|nr:hypothetical protein BC937DRAFT_90625 [Endogone sp. FLAS-F59071]|eukprot:RUS16945.1 hypothetical protein BC937DRAFT_90625 [Endogone sp. FLAS-F59071]